MTKQLRNILISVVIIAVIIGTAVVSLLFYYTKTLPMGVWVNDIYSTGKSLAELEQVLEGQEHNSFVEIEFIDGSIMKVDASGYIESIDYGAAIEKRSTEMMTLFHWGEREFSFAPLVQIKENELRAFLEEEEMFETTKSQVSEDAIEVYSSNSGFVWIEKTEEGFRLIDETKNHMDESKTIDTIIKALEQSVTYFSLEENGCYYDIPYTEDDYRILSLYDRLHAITNKFSIELTSYEETYVIDASILKDLILRTEDGEFVTGKDGSLSFDEDLIIEYANDLAKSLTTRFQNEWKFQTTDGETVMVEAGTYGRIVNEKHLENFLMEAFEAQVDATCELEFNYYPASSDGTTNHSQLPNSYLELDMEDQMVYLYLDGVLEFESPCVTGNVRRRMDTPTGVYYIDFVQKGRTLVGADYRTYVDYWMHFYSACGFHDADWRSEFGGDIYLTDGSHGCVNLPPEKAEELYPMVEKGLVVISY